MIKLSNSVSLYKSIFKSYNVSLSTSIGSVFLYSFEDLQRDIFIFGQKNYQISFKIQIINDGTIYFINVSEVIDLNDFNDKVEMYFKQFSLPYPSVSNFVYSLYFKDGNLYFYNGNPSASTVPVLKFIYYSIERIF